ncbi:hypothetical protein [Pontibacter beigongshangensis]|nr:hypothetical protein [Pontibacter beigongshangensis]
MKNKVNRKKTFKWFVIIYILVAVASTVGNYLLKADRVAKKRESIEHVEK